METLPKETQKAGKSMNPRYIKTNTFNVLSLGIMRFTESTKMAAGFLLAKIRIKSNNVLPLRFYRILLTLRSKD